MTFLSTNDLINAILSMAITTKVPTINIPNNLVDEIDVLFPQNISQQQILDVKDSINHNTPCFEAIIKSNISFPFKPDLLTQISENKEFISQEPNVASTIVFFSYLSWCIANFLKSTNTDHISTIFDSLKAIFINCPQLNCKNIAISSMYNLFTLILPKEINGFDFDAKIDLIFNVTSSIPNIPTQFFDIVVKSAYILMDSNPNEETILHFTQTMLNLLKQFHNHFPKTVFDILSPIISKKATSLDKMTIDLISTICQTYGSDIVAPHLASILMYLASQIKENSVLPIAEEIKDDSDLVMLAIRTKDESPRQIQVQCDTDFRTPIDLKTMPITIPESEHLESLISPKLKETLTLITTELKGKSDLVSQLIILFNHFFTENTDFYNSYDALAFTIIFIVNIYESCRFQLPNEIIFHKTIFNPSITAFNPVKNWDIISSLRSAIVNFLFHRSPIKLYKYIVECSRFPLLFAELLYRLIPFLKKMPTAKEFASISYTLLLESNIYYENMTGLDENEIKCIIEARFSIFYILEKLMRSNKVIVQFFNNEKFMNAYIPLVFENSLQPFIVSTLTRFSQNTTFHESTIFSNTLIHTLEQSSNFFDEPTWVGKNLKLMNIINNFINKDDHMCAVFERSIPFLCDGFQNLTKNEFSQSFLLSSIDFLTYQTKFHSLKSFESISLSAAIQKIVGENPPQEFFDNLVHLTAGSTSASSTKSFAIQQPKALRILLQIFTKSPLLSDVLDFIDILCKHSKENIIKVQEDEIDIILIDQIQKFREKEEDEYLSNLVKKILSLFSYIAGSGSSVAVVQRYISLFCLVNGRSLPWFHNLTIDTFISLLTHTTEVTKLSIPFTNSSEFELINLNNFSDEFTVCCWLCSNSANANYAMHIISLSEKKGPEIKIYLKNKSLLLCISDNNPIETKYPLALREWTLVSISFQVVKKNEQETYKVTLYNNSRKVKEISAPYVKFFRNNLQCSVGGTAGDSTTDPETPSVFNQISLYPLLTVDQIKLLNQCGSGAGNLNLQPIFIFVPHEPFDTIMLNNLVPNSQVISLTEIPPLYPSSFGDVFRKRVGLDLVLPIFAQWGLKSANGKEMSDLPAKSMTILRETLLRSEEAQRTFDEAHGVEIVSFLLQSAKKKTLNLVLYMHFFDIITNLSDKSLIENFFTHILTNIQLWIGANGADQLKIIRNWNKHLFPNYMSIAVKTRPFKWALNLMRVYYYYKKCESSIQKSRPDHIDIKSIRKNLFLLSIQLANESFTSDDLCYLICTIVSCPDEDQQMDYLHILNALIMKGKNSPVLKASDSFNYIKILQYLANSKNLSLSILSMQTLVNAYRASYFHPLKSDSQIDIILHQIPSESINQDFFKKLLDALKRNTPELFVIVSWMALNLGYNYIVSLYDELPPSPHYITSCSWCVWSIITMFRFNHAIAEKVSSFIIKCSVQNFGQIYSLVEVIGMVMKRSTDEMKALILSEFYKILKESKNASDSVIKIYFTYARHYLFFRNQPKLNDRLEMLMKDSPFADQIPSQPVYKSFNELVDEVKRRPNLNSDGTERYSPDLYQRAYQIIAPKKDEEIKDDFPSSDTIKVAASHVKLPTLMNVSFATNQFQAPQPNRRNLIRRNSIFTIQKTNTRQPSRRGLVFQSVSNKRRAAHAFISSSLNILLGNDSVALFNNVLFNKINYIFNIRDGNYEEKDLDQYTINWLDQETAFDFLIMFSIKPFTEFESTVVLISTILLYQNPDLAMKTLSNLNINKEELLNAVSYYDRNAIRTNKTRLLKQFSEIDLWNHSNEFLNSFISSTDEEINESYKVIAKQIKEYEDRNSRLSHETFSLLTPEYAAMATDSIADFNDSLNQSNTTSNKYWQQLWHNISIERAPWNNSLQSNTNQQLHYRRDLSLCYSNFPPKLKINYKFDLHLEASLVRDTGDQETGKSKTEELKEQLKTMYEQDSNTLSLFEISEDSIKEKSNDVFTKSKYIIELPCEIVKVSKTYEDAIFLLTDDSIVLTILDKKSIVISLSSIESIYPRTRYHHMTAIEIFTIDGLSYFVNFPNFSTAQILKSFKSSHVKIHPCDFKASLQQSKMTEKWQHRKISNFQYLMTLNLISGRSSNDISQYPVFPWIISDYDSKELDLNNPSVFRDLSKPIGALNEQRLEELKEKAQQLELMEMTPYLFSSCFLCPLTVCLYLLRLEPYTTMHIDIQGGHFDVPSRVFSSVKSAFNLCNNTLNDYRELVPEFYCMHEFLVNYDRFDLGYSGDEKIDDVKLPDWAHDNPMEFIYKNRKALESEYVSQNINNWIDLIWGDKQRGEKAWQANNVFLREMYADIWDVTPLDDVNQRANVEAILCNVGQVPPMLFDKPHPVCDPLPTKNIQSINAELNLPANKGILSIELKETEKGVAVFVIDSDYGFYSYNYDPLTVSKYASHSQNNTTTTNNNPSSHSGGDSTSSSIDQLNVLAGSTPSSSSTSLNNASSTIQRGEGPKTKTIRSTTDLTKLNPSSSSSSRKSEMTTTPTNISNSSSVTNATLSTINQNNATNQEERPQLTRRRLQAPNPGQMMNKVRQGIRDVVQTATNGGNQQVFNPSPPRIPKQASDLTSLKLQKNQPPTSPTQNEGQTIKKRFIGLTQQPAQGGSSFDIFGSFLNKNNRFSSLANNNNSINTKLINSFTGSESFDYVKENLHDIYRISKNGNSSRFKHRSVIKIIASDNKWVAVADRDSVVSLYYEKDMKFSIPLFSSSIKCLTISSTFHVAICATRDGFLLFSSLNSGTVTKTINLNGMRPVKLLITPSWGFVAVYLIELGKGKQNYYIKLYTINGDFIASRKLEHSIQNWMAFHTFHDFDYILMADSQNNIFLFEAFYLNVGKSIYTSDKTITALTYVQNSNCVVFASETGNLTFFTAKLPE